MIVMPSLMYDSAITISSHLKVLTDGTAATITITMIASAHRERITLAVMDIRWPPRCRERYNVSVNTKVFGSKAMWGELFIQDHRRQGC